MPYADGFLNAGHNSFSVKLLPFRMVLLVLIVGKWLVMMGYPVR